MVKKYTEEEKIVMQKIAKLEKDAYVRGFLDGLDAVRAAVRAVEQMKELPEIKELTKDDANILVAGIVEMLKVEVKDHVEKDDEKNLH